MSKLLAGRNAIVYGGGDGIGGGVARAYAREGARVFLVGRTPRLVDVAEVAAFLAGDRAGSITGSRTDVSAGLVLR